MIVLDPHHCEALAAARRTPMICRWIIDVVLSSPISRPCNAATESHGTVSRSSIDRARSYVDGMASYSSAVIRVPGNSSDGRLGCIPSRDSVCNRSVPGVHTRVGRVTWCDGRNWFGVAWGGSASRLRSRPCRPALA
jgi:hypothetical protein